MSTTTASDILIAPRNAIDTNPTRMTVSDVQVSWDVQEPGSLAFVTTVHDLAVAGIAASPIGFWVRYDHSDCGSWGGKIQSADVIDDVVNITAADFTVLAQRRVIDLKNVIDDAGTILKKAIAAADHDTPPTGLVIDDQYIESGGRQVGANWNDADLFDDVIPTLVTQALYYWTVDADRVVHLFSQPDLTADTPALVLRDGAGQPIIQPEWNDDETSIANSLTVRAQGFKSKGKKGKGSTALANLTDEKRHDDDSIGQYGWLERIIDWDLITTQHELAAYADRQIALLAQPQASVTLTLSNDLGAWRQVREGTLIRVELGLSGIVGNVIVENRALDVAAGTLTVGGPGRRVAT